MRIGIVNEKRRKDQLDLIGKCDDLIILTEEETTRQDFLEIVIAELGVIPLQLIQLLPSFQLLVSEKRYLTFIKRDIHNKLSAQAYFEELYWLAKGEEQIVKRRTETSIRKARENGKKIGRPTIQNELAERIYKMYLHEKKTIREIASACDVSVGTAYKYAMKLKETNK